MQETARQCTTQAIRSGDLGLAVRAIGGSRDEQAESFRETCLCVSALRPPSCCPAGAHPLRPRGREDRADSDTISAREHGVGAVI